MGYDYNVATTDDASVFAGVFLGMFSMVYLITILAVIVITLIGYWKIFEKAGYEGWKAIIPFYNLYILYKLTWGQGWMFLLMLVPGVNVIIGLVTLYKLAEAFGKGVGFFFGLWLINPVFILILGFGQDKYVGSTPGPNMRRNENGSMNYGSYYGDTNYNNGNYNNNSYNDNSSWNNMYEQNRMDSEPYRGEPVQNTENTGSSNNMGDLNSAGNSNSTGNSGSQKPEGSSNNTDNDTHFGGWV